MKTVTWNIRGLHIPQKAKILRKNIHRTNPIVVFLQETKCPTNQLQEISKKIWRGSEGMGIDARGYAGGLGILWDPNRVILSSFNGNRRFISAEFRIIGFSVSGVLTNVYGPQNPCDKIDFINTLRSINDWIEGRD